MPAYNAALYINESIDSVRSQSYKEWELVVVDDGSTDNTAELVKRLSLLDARIKYYYQENGRQGKARNLGLKYSKGDFIAFLDADDVWSPSKLDEQIRLIDEKSVDLVFGNAYKFETSSNLESKELLNEIEEGFYVGTVALEKFYDFNRIPILTVLATKDSIVKVNGFSENLEIQNAEDYHLWMKLLQAGYRFYGNSSVVSGYRVHGTSATSSAPSVPIQSLLAVYDILKVSSNSEKLLRKYNWQRLLHALNQIDISSDNFIIEYKKVLIAGGYKSLSKLIGPLSIVCNKKQINYLLNDYLTKGKNQTLLEYVILKCKIFFKRSLLFYKK